MLLLIDPFKYMTTSFISLVSLYIQVEYINYQSVGTPFHCSYNIFLLFWLPKTGFSRRDSFFFWFPSCVTSVFVCFFFSIGTSSASYILKHNVMLHVGYLSYGEAEWTVAVGN